MTYWPRCPHLQKRTIPLRPQRRSPNTMRSSSGSQRVTATCPPRSRYSVSIFRRIYAHILTFFDPQTFWDATGKLWAQGSLVGKHAGVFVSTSGPGGGQETTAITFMSTLVHHGIIFVPLGYGSGYAKLVSLEEVHGGVIFYTHIQAWRMKLRAKLMIGSPWGAGTFAAPDGSRHPTKRELEIAECQGRSFYELVSRVH